MKLEDAQALTEVYMEQYKLQNWSFKFNKEKRRFGYCNHSQRIISLSEPLTTLNEEKNVENTILHEIAHALVGHFHSHDNVWKTKAKQLGCNGHRCYDSSIIEPKGLHQYQCPVCGNIKHTYRLLKCKHSCGKCSPNVYDEKYVRVRIK